MSKNSISLSKKYGLNPTIPICFWCGEDRNEIALLGKIGGRNEDLEAPMKCIIDYEPCDCCKEKRKLGVTLIEVTEDSPGFNLPEIQNGIYPTGRWCVIRDEVANRMFGGYLEGQKMLFVDHEIYTMITRGAS